MKVITLFLKIETQGALQVKKMMPEAVMIFVLPPNADTLKEKTSWKADRDYGSY